MNLIVSPNCKLVWAESEATGSSWCAIIAGRRVGSLAVVMHTGVEVTGQRVGTMGKCPKQRLQDP